MNENQPPTEGYEPEDSGELPRDDQASGASPEPDWLRDMSGDQETPDWLRRLFEGQPEDDLLADAGLLTDAGLLIDSDLPAQEEPDEELAGVESEEPEDADAGRSGTDELRQWFRSVEGEAGPPEDKDALPEWLQALDATDSSAERPTAEGPGLPDETPVELPEDEEVPAWLRDLDEPVQEALPEEPGEPPLPDWLRDLDDASSEVEEPPAPVDVVPAPVPQETGDLPEWLVEMTEEVGGEAREAAFAAPTVPASVSEELSAMDELSTTEEPPEALPEEPQEERPEEPQTEEPPEQLPEELPVAEEVPSVLSTAKLGPPAEPEPPQEYEPLKEEALSAGASSGAEPTVAPLPEIDEPPAPETVAPELLVEDAPQEQEVPLWLTEIDQQSPDEMLAPPGLPVGAEDKAQANVPDWLAEADEAPVEEAEAPEWIQDLRGEDEEEVEPEPDLEIETSGPLAGLAGLLSPQPLAGLSSKATFKPAPAVPEEQHILAARVREMLDEPPARPELSVAAPGRTVMRALGHWLIYLALVAVIVAAMFLPALQDLVLAPETAGSKDAYVTLLALPPGSEVLLVVDYDAAHDGELTPLTRVLLWHLITSGQRVVMVSHTPQGTAMGEDLLRSRALWAYNPAPVAGEEVLNLGYLPPHPASMQAFMADPLGGAVLWGKGIGAGAERAQDTPLGQEIDGFDDLDAIVLVSASQEHTRWWIEQTRQAAPMLAAVSASAAPTLLPYYGSTEGAQLGGMLVGLAGAAEYERLCGAGFVPSARQNMILQGSAQILLAAIVLVSGISLVVRRALGRKG